MKKNHVKKSIAKKLSWQPGGPSRIAHEKRMQEKKTMGHRPSEPAAEVIGHPEAEMACRYYRSACVLLLADDPDYRKPAERLISEADAILGIA